ncbi:MAG TPA: anthranilate phosphoribosyltransferase [Patescibacteria group bacterium]|nr:anthranilate phosphoribosyltransferase [Patescibacteria group bacterium]
MESTILLNNLLDKKNVTTSETKIFLENVMKGEVPSSQLAAILVALRMKGETVDEIVGFIKAMREQMVHVSVKDAIDVCGTGGDGSKSFNISTAASFVIAGTGVRVAKHGNRAASSTCGSADVLETLGVNINLSSEQAKKILEKVGMVFLFAPLFHPATKHVVAVRKELKVRTIFNYIGPFLNPASVKRQIIGVPNREIAEKLIQVGKKLDYKHLLIITSDDGMDEISLSAETYIVELKNNSIKKIVIDPEKLGFTKVAKKEIEEGTLEQNAEFIKEILNGVKNAKRDIVVLNSAVALYAAGKVKTIKQGIALAEKAIDSGAAKNIFELLRKETKKYEK